MSCDVRVGVINFTLMTTHGKPFSHIHAGVGVCVGVYLHKEAYMVVQSSQFKGYQISYLPDCTSASSVTFFYRHFVMLPVTS